MSRNEDDLVNTTDYYVGTVNRIIDRHTADIRAASSLPYELKNKIRNLISRHNDDLFNFIKPDTIDHSGFAAAIRSKLSIDSSPFGKSIMYPLKLDCSMNDVVAELNAGYSSAVGAGASLDSFVSGFNWILEQYRTAGEAVFRAEGELNEKLGKLNATIRKAETLSKLPDNAALQGVYDAFVTYINTTFAEVRLEDTYKDLIENYKKWSYLYNIVSAQRLFSSVDSDDHLCSICVAHSVTHTVSPCGHTFCSMCIMKMNTACYICRGSIRDRIRLFF
jgi:hypothetical protein